MYYPKQPYPVYGYPDSRLYEQQHYWHPDPYAYYYGNVRPETYPEVDPTLFNQSATAFRKLLDDASIVLDKLSDSEEFAYKIMDAAQQGQTEKVKELIKSTGIPADVEVSYNPDGINLSMQSEVEDTECCKLTMALRWR